MSSPSPSSFHTSGSPVYPPIGRSAGPNGTVRSDDSSNSLSSRESFTPMVEPNNPANMLPLTNAPRLPNIGLTTTPGWSGTTRRNRSFSSSVALGISMASSPGGRVYPQDLDAGYAYWTPGSRVRAHRS